MADASVLRANAWCGAGAEDTRGEDFDSWGLSGRPPSIGQPLAPDAIDLAKWMDPRVGWGIVLPESDRPATEKAKALDAPDCIRALLKVRGDAPVLRYMGDEAPLRLRRYDAQGKAAELGVRGLRGVGPNCVPQYLLIVGSPAAIPWRFQYRLQLDAMVGRLDLDLDGLETYVNALLEGFAQSKSQRTKPVVWAVDLGQPDITRLMRRTIADRLADALKADNEFDMQGGVLSDAGATHAELMGALAARRPTFIATSSHGATYPLDDALALGANLGLPVDVTGSLLSLGDLSAAWQPDGAIWYAHACCSMGCDAESSFSGIASATSSLGRTLTALEAVGARTAPLPKMLLSASKPARAFIGHVEPSFDWTLRDMATGQVTTSHIVDALYGQLHLASEPPIGLALHVYHRALGGLWKDCENAKKAYDQHKPGAEERVRMTKLIASDLEAMVLFGDPTVTCT